MAQSVDQFLNLSTDNYETFLDALNKNRDVDEDILKSFFDEDKRNIHTSLFCEIADVIRVRKTSLNLCINEMYEDLNRLKIVEESLSKHQESKKDVYFQKELLADDLKYKTIFLSLVQKEQKREEDLKLRAMQIILARGANHDLVVGDENN